MRQGDLLGKARAISDNRGAGKLGQGRAMIHDKLALLRRRSGMSQQEVAATIGVTRQTVSNWESGRGLPDISLIESLAAALGVSVAELLTGDVRQNANRAGNMLRSRFYVCPICGNVVHALGEGSFSCCGSQLISQEAEEPDEHHNATVTYLDGSWHVLIDHPMTKQHYISFIAYVTSGGIQLAKLYPEQEAEVRIPANGSGYLYFFCNQHGLFRMRTPRRR